jgi:hypothetical protein
LSATVIAAAARAAKGDNAAAKSFGMEDCGVWAREHGYPGFCIQVTPAPLAALMLQTTYLMVQAKQKLFSFSKSQIERAPNPERA